MRYHRDTFERRYGIRWEYENDILVDRYLRTKRAKQALVDNLARADYIRADDYKPSHSHHHK